VLPAIHDILGRAIAALATAAPGPGAGAGPPGPLSDPAGLERWLFERPLVTGLALAAFAVALFVLLNRRGKPGRAVAVGGGFMAAAVLAAAVGFLVETPRERMLRLSNELVDAVAAGRTADAAALLADDLVVAVGSTPLPGGGALARSALESFGDRVRVTEHVVTDESARVGDPPTGGLTQFLVRATTDVGPGSAWVRLTWRKGADGAWRVAMLEVLRINGQSPEAVGASGFLTR